MQGYILILDKMKESTNLCIGFLTWLTTVCRLIMMWLFSILHSYMVLSSIKYKSFTLIELLIVIVIIGILATALIPRLTWSQARARDMVRITHLQQLQTALELYRNENGKYPGAGHYVNVIGLWCTHTTSHIIRTSVFNVNFIKNYISSLPFDPMGVNQEYCYWYTMQEPTNGFCTKKDGSKIEVDWTNTLWEIVGPQWNYVLTFIGETDLTDKYALRVLQPSDSKLKRYCMFPYWI